MATDPSPERKRPAIASYVLLAAALLIFIETFALVAPIMLSFLLILLISLAVNPVILWLEGWTGGRRRATSLAAVVLIAAVGLMGWSFAGPIKESYTEMAAKIPTYWERLQRPLIKMEQKAESSEKKLQAEVTTEIAQAAVAAGEPVPEPPAERPAETEEAEEEGKLRSGLGGMLEGVFGRFTTVAFNTAQILVVLVTVFFGVTYTLMNPRPIFGSLFSVVPERHHERALCIMRRIGKFVPGWAGATLISMLSIGLLVFLCMWPIFGFRAALMLGLISGLLEAVPYLGPILSALPALLLAVGEGGMTPLWVLLCYVGVQIVENNVIMPFVMARGLKLHPLAVILSMLLCVAAFGVLGVLIAAPLVAIVDILHDEIYRRRFLPTVTNAELDRLARKSLYEKASQER